MNVTVEHEVNCPRANRPSCKKKVLRKLAGIKTTLYNPHLPTFKKAAHDTALGKLSDEHSRTTLPYGVETFATEKWFNYEPPNSFIPKFSMMNLEEEVETAEESKIQAEIRSTLEDAYQKTSGAFLMPIGRLIQIPTVKKISYLNFPVRLMTPELTQKWRDSLKKCGPIQYGVEKVESNKNGPPDEAFEANSKMEVENQTRGTWT